MFVYTTSILKVQALTKRKKVIQGGSSASKTYAILAILIDKAASTPNLEISVISESIPHLKRGALKDFIKIMKMTNRWVDDHYNISDRKYTFHNGSYMEFYSPESVLGARRNILYINEANNIHYKDYHQLSIRTSDEIYIDFNPAAEFWGHTEILNEDDSELLILTYLDNEALPLNVISDFDNAKKKALKEMNEGVSGYWTNWCKVYIDGQIGSLQGTVFQFEVCESIPSEAQMIAYGMDWGFSADPTTLVSVYRFNQNLYIDELIYQTGLTNSDIINRMNSIGINKNYEIIADSAEPKSIEDLKRGGYSNIRASIKGADSIRNSIDTLQQFKIFITRNSINAIKEFRMYSWEVGKDGKQTGRPIDSYNHTIDSLRYVALNKINKRAKITVYR